LGGDYSVLAKWPEAQGFSPSAPKFSKRTSPHHGVVSRVSQQCEIRRSLTAASSASKYALKQTDFVPQAKPFEFRICSVIILLVSFF